MTSAALERTIADLWRQVLGVAGVQPDENFFDLGGDSVLMIRVHRMLCDALGTPVPILQLFQHPTIRALAAALPAAEGAAVSHQQMLRGREASPLRPPAPAEPADPFAERARKQHAARARLRDHAQNGSGD
jgi:nonribosomal peptide synthetase DhbF